MPEKDRTQYILRKRHLSPEELAAQTGMSLAEVRTILDGKEVHSEKAEVLPILPVWVWGLALGLAVVLAYLPVFRNDFVNWDDKGAILDNLAIRHLDLPFLKWAFTTYLTGNWIPLTWVSFALDYSVNGLDPRVFHATNLFFHVLDTLLVFGVCQRVLERMPKTNGTILKVQSLAAPIAFLTALLFGLHPIHVESVAWATERKDVLYSFFYLWALYLYLGPDQASRKPRVLGACAVLYGLSLMAKPMAVTLPFILLVFDYWPLGRIPRDLVRAIKEKAGFLGVAVVGALVTFLSHVKTLSYAQSGVEFYWVLNAFRSLLFYLGKMVWPVGLSAYYPFPTEATTAYVTGNIVMTALVLIGIHLSYRWREKFPFFLAATAYYVVSLLPVLGIVQTGAQAAADRYTYLPSLAPFLLFSVGAAMASGYRVRILGPLSLILALVLGFLTGGQIGTWKNTQVLWERVTEVYPDENADAYSRLGAAYLKAKRYDEALAAFSRAAAIPPPLARTFHGLGTALTFKERIPEAVQSFQYALALDPNMTGPRLNLWVIDEKLGKHEAAAEQMRQALKVTPNDPEFQDNLGVSLTFLKRYEEARIAFETAHRLDPAKADFLVNLATIRQWEGHPEDSINLYQSAFKQNPFEPIYALKLADLYLGQGQKKKVGEWLQRARALRPNNPKLLQQMGEDYQGIGQAALAKECFSLAKKMAEAAGGKELTTRSGTKSDGYSLDQNTGLVSGH